MTYNFEGCKFTIGRRAVLTLRTIKEMTMKIIRVAIMFAVIFGLVATAGVSLAGDISDKDKAEIQGAMKEYVKAQTDEGGKLPVVYQGEVLMLELRQSKKYPDGFHPGIVSKGDLFASCADFTDPRTKKNYDIDFLVNKVNDEYIVVQPTVHKVDGIVLFSW